MLLLLAVLYRLRRKRHTFSRDPATHERQGKLCSGPNEAEVTRKLHTTKADANSVPIHGDNGDFPAAENGERYFASQIPVSWVTGA
jgi:hypothetical protein